jgi:hypothetical protein
MHLFDLARAANATPNRRRARRPTQERVRPVAVNHARFVFLSPRPMEFFVDWDTIANDCVGILRAEAGDPYDKRLLDLIGELSTRSEEFRVLAYSAELGSPSHQSLQLLASWASTPQGEPADPRKT